MNPLEESVSIWQEFSPPFTPALSSHQTADVCIIGAGIASLSVAYQLLREGKSVVVLERDTIGHGQTGLTSGHLSSALDEGFEKIRAFHGQAKAKLSYESHHTAIQEIERIVSREQINCDFERVDGYLFLSPDKTPAHLHAELEAARECGVTGIELLPDANHGMISTGECLRFKGQAQFHPEKYILGLVAAIQKMGGKIFPQTEAQEIEGGKPTRVTTARGFQVVAGAVVVATNSPFNDRITMQTKMAPYRTYVVAIPIPTAEKPALFWDTGSPYHYVRFVKAGSSGQSLLLVGGEDHRTGQDPDGEDRFKKLADWAKERFGISAKHTVSWSGQVLEPHDGLAYIGKNPGDEENIYIVTGDSGHGLTHGTIAGLLLKDMLLGQDNAWSELYDPSRVSLRSFNTFLKETVNSTAPYSDWLSPGDVASFSDILPGEGAIVRDGLQKIAAFKDSLGRLHLCSAVCPHLKGIVRWNSAEKTWDCPCHGSRFDRTGKVILGPATTGLAEIATTLTSEQQSASA